MAIGRMLSDRQKELFIAASAVGALDNPFYAALDKLLRNSGFDEFADGPAKPSTGRVLPDADGGIPGGARLGAGYREVAKNRAGGELMRTRARLGEMTMRVELQAELLEKRGYGDELRKLLKRLGRVSLSDEPAVPADDGMRDLAGRTVERVCAASATGRATDVRSPTSRGSAARRRH